MRVIEVPQAAVAPRVLGYGMAQPGKVWQAVAEVKGKIVERHPQLKRGAIVPAGTVLIRIDPTAYTLTIAQMEANIQDAKAQLAELDVKAANTQASLDIEEHSLALAEKERQRIQNLSKRDIAARSQLDQEQRTVLTQRKAVQGLRNTLNLIPAERQALQAKLALYQSQLASAKLDLAHTTITAPFPCRIAQVNVETTQFVPVGQVLTTADSIDVAEITAQFPLDKLRTLITPGAEAIAFDHTVIELPPVLRDLSAQVRLRSGEFSVAWAARVARVSETIDPQTRTVGVVVAVDEPYAQAKPGIRPPVVKGMFLEVELRGKPRPGCFVVPRSALRDHQVYVLPASKRLEKRSVQVDFVQQDVACLREGVTKGDTVVVSDLIPAIEGMRLDPVRDDVLEQSLWAAVKGAGAVR